MSVSGPTRVGKSHIAKLYTKKINKEKKVTKTKTINCSRKMMADVSIIPVLYKEVEVPASIGSLGSILLKALGDPMYNSLDRVGLITDRLQYILEVCEVELIILDEIQHFVDRNQRKLLWDISDWLKTSIIDVLKIPVVIVGTPETKRIFTNPQLNGRFLNKLTLEPFKLSVSGDKDKFLHVLKMIDDNLPLKMASNFTEPDFWERIYLATNGRMFYLMELIKRSTELALQDNYEVINHTIMSTVYDKNFAHLGYCEGNPFEPSFNLEHALEMDKKKEIEPYDITLNGRISKKGRN